MRWYVSRNGETVGPIEEAQLAAKLRQGPVESGTYVRDAAGGPWMPIEASPLGGLLPRKTGTSGAHYVSLFSVVIVLLALGTCGYVWHSFDQHSKCMDAERDATAAARSRDNAKIRTARIRAEHVCDAENMARLDRELFDLGYYGPW